MERRLAAVMIADVAGYGRLSQADEEGTRARFQADLHEVFEPRIAAHHGGAPRDMTSSPRANAPSSPTTSAGWRRAELSAARGGLAQGAAQPCGAHIQQLRGGGL